MSDPMSATRAARPLLPAFLLDCSPLTYEGLEGPPKCRYLNPRPIRNPPIRRPL